MSKQLDIAECYIGVNELGKLALIKYYNDYCFSLVNPARRYRMKPSDPWCAMFVSVAANLAGLGAGQFPYEVSCNEQMKWGQANGRFTKDRKQVKEGDLILFDWNFNGLPNHVGFIKSINSGSIQTVEGNYNKTVGCRVLSEKSPSIIGFIQI